MRANKWCEWLAIPVLALTLCGVRPVLAQSLMPEPDIYFSPHGGATDAIVHAIDTARSQIRVQAYSFTSRPIITALVAAARRGVDVAIVLDKSDASGRRYGAADYLVHQGIPTFIDRQHAIAHNKIMIIDGQTTITGSFNFTRAAETSNAENLLVLHSTDVARRYLANWQLHRAHSEPYQGRGGY